MDKLEEYLQILDKSNFDQTNEFQIDKELQLIRDEYSKESRQDLAKKAQLEMEVFNFTKKDAGKVQ